MECVSAFEKASLFQQMAQFCGLGVRPPMPSKIDLSHFDNELGDIAGDSVLLLFRVGALHLTKRLIIDILCGKIFGTGMKGWIFGNESQETDFILNLPGQECVFLWFAEDKSPSLAYSGVLAWCLHMCQLTSSRLEWLQSRKPTCLVAAYVMSHTVL